MQFLDPSLRDIATTYYGVTSGVGRCMEAIQRRGPVNAGVIGLGVGTLASYGRPGDRMAFYEINPEVERIARAYFTFLGDCKGTCEVFLGDGRLVLDRQGNQRYDLLVVDAFNSDSIPLHLLTTQAMQVYLRQVKADGVLAFHTTSANLDLEPVLAELARHDGLLSMIIVDGRTVDDFSRWILVSSNQQLLAELSQGPGVGLLERRAGQALWTDDYVNVIQVLRTGKRWRWHGLR